MASGRKLEEEEAAARRKLEADEEVTGEAPSATHSPNAEATYWGASCIIQSIVLTMIMTMTMTLSQTLAPTVTPRSIRSDLSLSLTLPTS